MKNQCKFKKLCMLIYPEFNCMNNYSKECKLIIDLKNNKISDFIISLIKKELNSHEMDTLFKLRDTASISCPRSVEGKAILSKNCIIQSCPFYSKNIGYHCILIHSSIFFPNSRIPINILEIATGKSRYLLSRYNDIGIYLSRFLIIMMKFKQDFKFKHKLIKNFYDKDVLVCPVCNNIYKINKDCDCLTNKKIRFKRINFEQLWQDWLKKAYITYKDEIVNEDYKNIANSNYVRSLLANLNYNKLTIFEIPFGYLFNTYHKMFKDNDDIVIENFGLNEKTYKKACKYYLIEN